MDRIIRLSPAVSPSPEPSKGTVRLTLVLLAFLLILPTVLGAEVLTTRSWDGDLVVVSTFGQGSHVLLADETRVDLPLAPTAIVHAFAATDRQWFAAAVDTAGPRRLVVLTGNGPRVKELAAPPVKAPVELREPTLLLDDKGLAGLGWLEGPAPRQQVLRVAWKTFQGWREPVTVSQRGPGSQMALTSTRLADGSWLLAWAAFDGRDDEILWSRLNADGATAPARLGVDNGVPDITPHLWAAGDGALAAWSRYDGNDYRVHLARFDGSTWSQDTMIGPKGSVYPTFYAGASGPLLLFLQAVPRSWQVAELGPDGKIRRRAGVETLRPERPLIREASPSDVSLLWLGGDEPELVAGLALQAVE